jgi:hypothetical protein
LALLVATAAAVYVLATTCAKAMALTHPLPFWDQWDFVETLGHYFAGHYGIADLWQQHNEHRILFPRLLFFADALLFGSTNTFLVLASLALQFVHVVLLSRLLGDRTGLPRAACFAVPAICLFHGSQIVNLYWGFQVQFVLVWLASTVALWSMRNLVAAGGGRARVLWLCAAVASGLVATGSMGNGVLIWPLMCSMALQMRAGRRVLLTLLVAGGLSVAAYSVGYVRPEGRMGLLAALSHPADLVAHVCHFLASPFWICTDWVKATAGAITLLIAGFLAVAGVLRWRRQGGSESVLWHILLMALASSILAAIGRLHLPLPDVATSRYATPVLVGWVVVFGLSVPRASAWSRALASRVLLAACALAFLTVLQPEVCGDVDAFPEQQNDATSCLLANIKDDAALRLTHGVDPSIVMRRSEILRRNRLSVFRHGTQFLIGAHVEEHFQVSTTPPGPFDLDQRKPLTEDPGAVRLSGWAYDRRTGRGYATILVADEQWRIVGFGNGLARRPDVARTLRAVCDSRVGWHAWARPCEPNAVLNVLAVLDNGRVALLGSTPGARADLADSVDPVAVPAVITALETSGGWSPAGDAAGIPASPQGTPVWRCWNAGDQDVGHLRALLAIPDGMQTLAIPVLTGPDPSGMSVRVTDPFGHEDLACLIAPENASARWKVWRIRIPTEPRWPRLVQLDAADRGRDWGQWLAIACPWLAR